MVCLSSIVTHPLKPCFNVLIPYMATPLGPIYCLVKLQHYTFWDVEARRRLHVNFFFEFPIQVGRLDIYLVNLKVKLSGKSQDGAEQ